MARAWDRSEAAISGPSTTGRNNFRDCECLSLLREYECLSAKLFLCTKVLSVFVSTFDSDGPEKPPRALPLADRPETAGSVPLAVSPSAFERLTRGHRSPGRNRFMGAGWAVRRSKLPAHLRWLAWATFVG